MKKLILFAAILFAGVSVVKADEPITKANSSTDKTNLTVTLKPIQTITVDKSGVDLVYETETHYSDGVTTNKEGHLTIYSTGGFAVNVKSLTDELIGDGDETKRISSKTISVKASAEEGVLLSPKSVPLSKEGSTLFSSTVGGPGLVYNVNYTGAKLNGYFNKLFNKGAASVFKTDVIYTITPL